MRQGHGGRAVGSGPAANHPPAVENSWGAGGHWGAAREGESGGWEGRGGGGV